MQCLLTLLDSPLNKSGLLKIFVHTTQGISIEVHPDVRIPRTYKRYSGLMGECAWASRTRCSAQKRVERRRLSDRGGVAVQLLQEGEIRGASDAQVLMRVLKVSERTPDRPLLHGVCGQIETRIAIAPIYARILAASYRKLPPDGRDEDR